jgi:hypothetical protein
MTRVEGYHRDGFLVITDRATFGYLCDVNVLTEWRVMEIVRPGLYRRDA